MGLNDIIKKDIQKFTSNTNEFGTELFFESGNPYETARIAGLHTDHSFKVDSEGNTVNSNNIHCSCSEQLLIDAGYPVRNGDDEVDMEDHYVTITNSTGVSNKYKIRQVFPDQRLGYLVFMLDQYAGED